VIISTVVCSELISPNYGNISCSLEDDGVPSYEDTCSFTCNTGYKLTGSDTRTCQSNGSWNGSTTMCIEGMFPYNIVLLYSGECRIFERGFLVIMK